MEKMFPAQPESNTIRGHYSGIQQSSEPSNLRRKPDEISRLGVVTKPQTRLNPLLTRYALTKADEPLVVSTLEWVSSKELPAIVRLRRMRERTREHY